MSNFENRLIQNPCGLDNSDSNPKSHRTAVLVFCFLILGMEGLSNFIGKKYGWKNLWKNWFKTPPVLLGVIYAIAIVFFLVFKPNAMTPFIYFQF